MPAATPAARPTPSNISSFIQTTLPRKGEQENRKIPLPHKRIIGYYI
jgi:hypothetical protein